jgi:hypothetical protein
VDAGGACGLRIGLYAGAAAWVLSAYAEQDGIKVIFFHDIERTDGSGALLPPVDGRRQGRASYVNFRTYSGKHRTGDMVSRGKP